MLVAFCGDLDQTTIGMQSLIYIYIYMHIYININAYIFIHVCPINIGLHVF